MVGGSSPSRTTIRGPPADSCITAAVSRVTLCVIRGCISYTCDQCGEPGTMSRYRYKVSVHHYCSRKCMNQHRRTTHPHLRPLTFKCPICLGDFSRQSGKFKKGTPCCSQKCGALHTVRKREMGLLPPRGRKPSFRRSLRGTARYATWRKAVLRLHNGACSACGGKDRVHVHHIRHFADLCKTFLSQHSHLSMQHNRLELIALAKEHPDFWSLDGATCLCLDCHAKEHPELPYADFFKRSRKSTITPPQSGVTSIAVSPSTHQGTKPTCQQKQQ